MKKLLSIGVIATIFYFMFKENAKLSKPVEPLEMRNDPSGQGHFGASRGRREHQGVDYLVEKGQSVFSPIHGTVTRSAQPYASDSKYQGCVIENDDYEVKLFYMIPTKIGNNVKAGEKIGIAQAISEKYGGSMKDHIHIEVRTQSGELLNPSDLLKNA